MLIYITSKFFFAVRMKHPPHNAPLTPLPPSPPLICGSEVNCVRTVLPLDTQFAAKFYTDFFTLKIGMKASFYYKREKIKKKIIIDFYWDGRVYF